MFNLASCRLQCSCSRGRCFKRLGAKARIVRGNQARGPRGFRFLPRKRRTRMSRFVSANKNVESIGGILMNIRPLHDRIVVKPIETCDSTSGGLFIPDSAKEKPHEGKVVAVSRGKRLEDGSLRPLDVTVGDHILYGKYTGSEIKLAGEEYLIVREDEVLGVLEGAEKPATKVA